MTRLDCRLGKLGTGTIPQDIVNGGARIIDAFAEGSFFPGSPQQIQISIDDQLSKPIQLRYWTGGPIRAFDLQEALRHLVGSSSQRRASDKVGILYATTFAAKPDLAGIMFDVGFVDHATNNPLDLRQGGDNAPREGAALFLDTIARVSGNNYDQQVLFTTIHEIGHMFNLEHVQGEMNYMKQGGGSSYSSEKCGFVKDHKMRLNRAACGDRNAWPGYSPFAHMDGADYFGPVEAPWGEARDPMFGLDLRLSVARASFHYFEPLELEVTLAVAPGLDRRFRVPDTIDPGYETFRIWIEEPHGQRRLYRSPRRYCWQRRWRTIIHQRPFQRDISFFGQSGGYTFRRAGVHRVWAEFALPKRKVLRSAPLDLEIRSLGASDPIVEDHAFLTARSSRVLLYHRLDRDGGNTLRRFEDWLEARPDASSHPAVRYAIGRALLERAENSGEDRSAEKLKEGAHEHSDDLGKHQRAIAERLLSDRLPSKRR